VDLIDSTSVIDIKPDEKGNQADDTATTLPSGPAGDVIHNNKRSKLHALCRKLKDARQRINRKSVLPQTLLALTLSSLCATAVAANLRAGAARVDITPAADATNPSTGKYAHAHLYVRTIVLNNGAARAVLIGADQAGLPEIVWTTASKQIAKELDCPIPNIVMSATHTHSGWGPGGPRAGNISSRPKCAPAADRWPDVVDPGSRLWTQGPNLNGSSDKTVAVIKLETPEGKPIAAYIDYAMHPVNGYLAGFTSADFAGATSRYVERAYGDKMVAVFVQGAPGDQNALASRSGAPITGDVLVREKVEAPLRDGKVTEHPLDPTVRDTPDRRCGVGLGGSGALQCCRETPEGAIAHREYRIGDVDEWNGELKLYS
jgi:hypothetical protein